MSSIRTRNHHWDNIKSVLIILTVFAHILYQLQDVSPIINYIVDIIYFFHMPAFIFVSGYFGKSERSHSAESILRFVFLFFIFNSAYGFIYGFDSLLKPLVSYWYLVALVFWRLITHHISSTKHIVLVLFLLAIIIGFHPSVNNTLALARTIGFLPFYMLGYKFAESDYSKMCDVRPLRRFFSALVILAAISLTLYFSFDLLSFSDATFVLGAYADKLDIIERIIMFFVSFLSIPLLLYISPRKKMPLLSAFGRNSLWIFVFHRPITLLASKFLVNTQVLTIIVASLIITFVICFLFGNDFLGNFLNNFAKSGAALLMQKEKKISLAKIALICVVLGFIALSFVEPSAGLVKPVLRYVKSLF